MDNVPGRGRDLSLGDRHRGRAAGLIVVANLSRSVTAISWRKMTRASSCKGVKQLVELGFVKVEIGRRRTNTFTLINDRQSIDADEAARRVPKPQRPRPSPHVHRVTERSGEQAVPLTIP